jgi:acetate kinase
MVLIVDSDLKKMKLWTYAKDRKKTLLSRFVIDIEEIRNDKIFKDYIRDICGNRKIKVIAFRILFGGDYFDRPALIDTEFFRKFEKITEFFPFYVPLTAEMLKRFQRIFKGAILVAFFETSFFVRLPEKERCYPLPFDCYKNNKIKKWGFHGIFHETNAKIFSQGHKCVSVVIDKQTTVCTAYNNKPFSISLGYTPLEGVMSRRTCGDVDPGIVFYLINIHGFSIYDIDEMLKNKSGFVGLTGHDIELNDMLKMRGRDTKVDLAFDVYQAQIIKYIGEGIAILGGVDNIVFSGNYVNASMPLIHDIIKKISFLGISTLSLPWSSDKETVNISSAESKVKVYINRMELAKAIFCQSELFSETNDIT